MRDSIFGKYLDSSENKIIDDEEELIENIIVLVLILSVVFIFAYLVGACKFSPGRKKKNTTPMNQTMAHLRQMDADMSR